MNDRTTEARVRQVHWHDDPKKSPYDYFKEMCRYTGADLPRHLFAPSAHLTELVEKLADAQDEIRRLSGEIRAKLLPDGYAYRYPDGYLRFSGGRKINGSMPTESIPYFLGSPLTKRGGRIVWLDTPHDGEPHDEANCPSCQAEAAERDVRGSSDGPGEEDGPWAEGYEQRSIRIVEFTISERPDVPDKVWIAHESGEAGEFSKEKLAGRLADFWAEEF